MSKNKVDWIIHYVNMKDGKNEMLGNAHTHGLDRHKHRELCIVLDTGQEIAMGILNTMGAMIAFDGKKFSDGLCSDVLQDGYNVEIISLPDDPVQYVILPDEHNKMPSDKGCAFPYNKQYEYARLVSKYTQSM